MRFVPALHSDHFAFHIPLPAVTVGKEKGTRTFKNECLEVRFAVCLLRTTSSEHKQPAKNIIFASHALEKSFDFPLNTRRSTLNGLCSVKDGWWVCKVDFHSVFFLLDENPTWFEIYDFLHINWIRSLVVLRTGAGLGSGTLSGSATICDMVQIPLYP